MSNGNYMCALRSFFIVSFFYNKSPSLLQTTDSIAHVFLVEGVGGASIASDRGSATRKGMERFLQPMGEGRAWTRRSGQWEASVPKATTEPLRGAGLRDTPSNQEAHDLRASSAPARGSVRLVKESRVVVKTRVRQSSWRLAWSWSRWLGLGHGLRSFGVEPRGGGD